MVGGLAGVEVERDDDAEALGAVAGEGELGVVAVEVLQFRDIGGGVALKHRLFVSGFEGALFVGKIGDDGAGVAGGKTGELGELDRFGIRDVAEEPALVVAAAGTPRGSQRMASVLRSMTKVSPRVLTMKATRALSGETSARSPKWVRTCVDFGRWLSGLPDLRWAVTVRVR